MSQTTEGRRAIVTESRRPRKTARRLVFLMGLLAAGAVAAVLFEKPLFHGNLGVVEPGVVYRAAQPKGNVGELFDSLKIASVLNLRGGSRSDDWYVAEVQAAATRKIDFYDLPMSATTRPPRKVLLQIARVLRTCKYPLLIHCKSGADRTGLAAGLYLMVKKSLPPGEAESALSLTYGHIPITGPERLHAPFDEYDAWLIKQGKTHHPSLFLNWVANVYQADDPTGVPEPLRPGPRDPLALQTRDSVKR